MSLRSPARVNPQCGRSCNSDRTVRLTTALRRSGIAVKSYDGAGVRITVADRSASDAVMRILAGWEP